MDIVAMGNLEENFGVIYEKKEYAGFIKRVVMAVIDTLVFLAFSLAWLFMAMTEYYEASYFKINFLFLLMVAIWYFALLKRSKYGTLGYKLTGVKIVDLRGETPSIFKMILRFFLNLVGPFIVYVDIMWLTSEATKQTLRDKFVGTYVVNKNAVPIGRGRLQTVTLGVMSWSLMYREIKEDKIK